MHAHIAGPARIAPPRARRRSLVVRVLFALSLVAASGGNVAAQEVRADQLASGASGVDVVRATLHGVVKNAVSGEPLPRVLVRLEGDAAAGTLTDGEGRFEMPGVPEGPQVVQVTKPGFADVAAAGISSPPTVINGATNSEHNVRVARDMPDVVFTLSPTNAVRGQLELSTGEPAQGIMVMLVRRTVQDGRALWQTATSARTNSDGIYRFAGLADGTYAVLTEPALDTDIPAMFVEAGRKQVIERSGFPSVFYPDARDLSSAAKIQVSGGQQAQANILLTEEPFYAVRANLALPHSGSGSPESSSMNVSATIFDTEGHQLLYTGQYDASTHSIQAFLPNGSYSMQATALGNPTEVHAQGRVSFRGGLAQGPLIGQTGFSVAGHAVSNLRIAFAPQQGNALQVALVRSGTPQANRGNGANPLVVMVSPASGWITDAMVSSYAEGYAGAPIETNSMAPGAYWVHTNIPQSNLCEASFTAGGANLAREPLVLSLSGSSAPLTLTLRDDCSTLSLSLPPSVEAPAAGEEPSYTVYVVPDSSSTVDVAPVTLRPSSGGMVSLNGLSPGSYHVYTFRGPVELEYRNPEALAGLPNPGQAITLAPSENSSLVLEVPQR